jgi:hypothetical protein
MLLGTTQRFNQIVRSKLSYTYTKTLKPKLHLSNHSASTPFNQANSPFTFCIDCVRLDDQ